MTSKHNPPDQLTPKRLLDLMRRSSGAGENRRRSELVLMGSHPTPEALFDYVMGRMSAEEIESWLPHLVRCPRCAKQVEEMRDTIRELGERFPELDKPLDDTNWPTVLMDLRSEEHFQLKSLAYRFFSEELVEPEPILSGGPTDGFQVRPMPYSCLNSELVERQEFEPGEQAVIKMIAPDHGYVTVFMLPSRGLPTLVFPAKAKVKTSVRADEEKSLDLTIPETLGEVAIKGVWTYDPILEPARLASEELDSILSSFFGHLQELPEPDWRTGMCFFVVKRKRSNARDLVIRRIQLPRESSILAIRAVQPDDSSAGYWIPVLFRDLRNGAARFGWSSDEGSNLTKLRALVGTGRGAGKRKLTSDQQLWWSHARFLLNLKSGDLLVYVNMPQQDKCTVVQVEGGYSFDSVWDPEKRGDFRHQVPCKLLGVFDRTQGRLHPELWKRLVKRGSHWSLNSVRNHLEKILSHF